MERVRVVDSVGIYVGLIEGRGEHVSGHEYRDCSATMTLLSDWTSLYQACSNLSAEQHLHRETKLFVDKGQQTWGIDSSRVAGINS